MTDIERLEPPDDTGSTTFARYCYQARIAFRYVMVCAADGSVAFVIPEHFEDVAVRMASGAWLFIQIKTRDLSRGPWKLSDVLSDDGAFRSLTRSCAALPVAEIQVTFVASLEGAIAAGDDLQCFVGGECTDERILSRVVNRLELSPEAASELLPRLRVVPESPMTAIDAMNLRRLGACMASARHAEVEATYDRCLGQVQRAMEAATLGPDWPVTLVGLEPTDPVSGKKIDAAALVWLAAELAHEPVPLLSRLIDLEGPPATQLEEKLLTAGATAEVINDAVQMRAMADKFLLERDAASVWDESDAGRDLDMRLTFLARAAVARFAQEVRPANAVWAHLHERLSAEGETHDPRRLLRGDPVLLMGRACGISDECGFEWRSSDA